jgi:hypothetical protein
VVNVDNYLTMIRFDGMVWYGMVWYGMVWYGRYVLVLVDGGRLGLEKQPKTWKGFSQRPQSWFLDQVFTP